MPRKCLQIMKKPRVVLELASWGDNMVRAESLRRLI